MDFKKNPKFKCPTDGREGREGPKKSAATENYRVYNNRSPPVEGIYI